MRYAIVVSFLLGFGAPSFALDEALVCAPSQAQDQLHYLRRLSLDLRGYLPSVEEFQFVAEQGEVSAQQIDEMLSGEAFVGRMRRYHRELLWVNIDRQRLSGNFWRLNAPSRLSAGYWLSANARGTRYRGARVGCADFEHSVHPDGSFFTQPHPELEGVVQEGWRWVRPYWNLDQRIKVCAFDAQEDLSAPNETNRGSATVDCSTSQASRSSKCGCGPDLKWCPTRTTEGQVRQSWDEQLLRFADAIVRDDRPYSELITAKDMEVNGPIVHYLRHQTMVAGNSFVVTGNPGYELPNDLSHDQVDEWRNVQRNAMHAGVLTTPAFLTKFQSNRGRANRFYQAFRCEDFQAPPGGLPATDDGCHSEPNLTKRCGCSYCHVSVEPAAAYWGRWSEAGIKPLIPDANSDAYPAFDPNCGPTGNQRGSLRCRRFYVNEIFPEGDSRKPYEGYLRSYLFADELGEQNGSYSSNIEEGPVGMAREILDPQDGTFARCASQRIFKHFTGRAFRSTETALRQGLTTQFQSDFNLRQLVRSIVTSAEYKEAARYGLDKEGGGL